MTTILRGDFVYRSKQPIVVERASGARLFANDREFIDCQASSGAAVLGYAADILDNLDLRGGPISKPQTCESARRLRLAARLEELIFGELDRHGSIGFELGGAQAIELALKVALCAHDRISILTIEGAYHGRSLFTSHLSSSRRYTLGTELSAPHFRLPNPFFLAEREQTDLAEATRRCVRFVEEAFVDERYGVTDAGKTTPVFLFEPVQNVAGMLDLPAAYLQTIERLVRSRQGICVADEIFSGLYRFGPLFAHVEKGLTPDMVAFSKGLTNGVVPLSAVWVSESSGLATTFRPGTHSCTYLNNELAFMVADCVLDRLAGIDKAKIGELGSTFLARVQKHCGVDIQSTATAKGSVLALRLPRPEDLSLLSARVVHEAPVGVLHASTGLAPRTIIFHPPYTIDQPDLGDAAAIVGQAVERTLG